MLAVSLARLLWISLCVLVLSFPAIAQSLQPAAPQPSESITGTIVDQTGTFVSGAQVRLARTDQSSTLQTESDGDGKFSFVNIGPGSFQLTISSEGFATKTISGTLSPGETFVVPQITLALATEVTEVRVSVSPVEIAEIQIKDQEKQRVFGLIPNFYVSYVPDAAPLNTKQKLGLAWKSSVDPLTLAGVGFVAGIEQAQNAFSGYGQRAQGYAKRYGSSYADVFIGTFMGSAILPAVFKQDPRYFYKGTGSTRSRIFHALGSSIMCK